MKTCPGCGKSCDDNDVYCGFCGFPLNNVAGQTQPQAPVQSQPSQTVPPAPSPVVPPVVPPVNNTQNYSTYQNNTPYQNTPVYQNNPQYNNYQQNAKPLDMRKIDPLAITALILGICGAVFMCCYGIGLLPAIVGLILGIISVKRTKAENSTYKGHGMALAGLITSAIACAISFVVVVCLIAGLAYLVPFMNDNMKDFENGFDSGKSDYYFSMIKSFFIR